jgi:hypothetical protein
MIGSLRNSGTGDLGQITFYLTPGTGREAVQFFGEENRKFFREEHRKPDKSLRGSGKAGIRIPVRSKHSTMVAGNISRFNTAHAGKALTIDGSGLKYPKISPMPLLSGQKS